MKETLFTVNSFINVIMTERNLELYAPSIPQCSYVHSRQDEGVSVCDEGLHCPWCRSF